MKTLDLLLPLRIIAVAALFLNSCKDSRVVAYHTELQDARNADQRALDTIETYGKQAEAGDREAMAKIRSACRDTEITCEDIQARYYAARERLDAAEDSALAAEMLRK